MAFIQERVLNNKKKKKLQEDTLNNKNVLKLSMLGEDQHRVLLHEDVYLVVETIAKKLAHTGGNKLNKKNI